MKKIDHSFEAREVKSAIDTIDTIERLMPPELFSMPIVVGTLCECGGNIETTYDSEMNLVCKECYNQLLV